MTKVMVVRGDDKHLKQEAIRLVNSIPKLQAAKQRGKSVPCSFTVPINFKLQ
ncbi:MAG: energy transducer TonB [Flavobacteriales bacterium]|nr:energy transducer TonB [Flavobacteriales bacterium]